MFFNFLDGQPSALLHFVFGPHLDAPIEWRSLVATVLTRKDRTVVTPRLKLRGRCANGYRDEEVFFNPFEILDCTVL